MLYKFQKTIDRYEKHPRGTKNTSTVHHCTNDDLHTTVQRNEFNLLNKPWLDRSNDPSEQEKKWTKSTSKKINYNHPTS